MRTEIVYDLCGVLTNQKNIITIYTFKLGNKLEVVLTSIQLKLKVVVGVCNYVILLANIFK